MRNILITGVCGTIGKTLLLKLLRIKKYNKIIGIDVNEEQLFLLESEVNNFFNCLRDTLSKSIGTSVVSESYVLS